MYLLCLPWCIWRGSQSTGQSTVHICVSHARPVIGLGGSPHLSLVRSLSLSLSLSLSRCLSVCLSVFSRPPPPPRPPCFASRDPANRRAWVRWWRVELRDTRHAWHGLHPGGYLFGPHSLLLYCHTRLVTMPLVTIRAALLPHAQLTPCGSF